MRTSKKTDYTALADKVAQITKSKVFDKTTPIDGNFFNEAEKLIAEARQLFETIELTFKINSHE